jgi:plasmid stabilization system protein ParE
LSCIAQDSPQAADGVEEAIYLACERPAKSPRIGTVRNPLQVIRILHHARNILALLR